MRLLSLIAFPAFVALAARAIYVPTVAERSDVAVRSRSLDAVELGASIAEAAHLSSREPCPSGCDGTPSPSDLGIDIDLSVFTKVQLDYLYTCVKALADLNVDATIKAKALRTVIYIVAYSSADLDKLVAALEVFLKYKGGLLGFLGLDSITKTVLANAHIDITSLTKADVDCLKVLISACLRATIDITVDIKKDLLNRCTSLVTLSVDILTQLCVSIQASINAVVHTTTDVVTDSHTTVVEATLKIKLVLKAYIESILATCSILVKVQLQLILRICQAWIDGDLNLLTTLGVQGIVDSSICAYIIALLNSCGYSGVDALLKLNLTVLSHTAVVLH